MNNLNEIIGHDLVIGHLRNALSNGKVSHAYLIEGDEGIGKKSLANAFSKLLQCENSKEEPCDSCNSCRAFDHNNHPDIKYVIPTKKTGIGVDDIRDQLNMDIQIKPYYYPYKIYIIDEAEKMSEAAQNALLKTLEEPPKYAVIILIASTSSLFLPTVLSRCVILSLKPIEEGLIKGYLLREGQPEEKAAMLSSLARGSIGRARQYLDSTEFDLMRNKVILAIDQMIAGDEYQLMEIAEELSLKKENSELVLDLFHTWLRDLLLIKKLKDERYTIHKDKYKTLLKQGELLSYNRIDFLIKKIEDIKMSIKFNVNYQLSLETMFLDERQGGYNDKGYWS